MRANDQDSPATGDGRDVLIPLRRFTTWTQAEELSEELLQFISGHGLAAPLPKVIWDIATELCDNAASHSGSPHGAFLAAQSYPLNDLGHIAVADLGVGIRHHLANNPRYSAMTSDRAAIREAIKRGVSGTSDARGWGFEEVQVQAGRAGLARLLITSGTGQGEIRISGSRRNRAFRDVEKPFPGTLVQLILER